MKRDSLLSHDSSSSRQRVVARPRPAGSASRAPDVRLRQAPTGPWPLSTRVATQLVTRRRRASKECRCVAAEDAERRLALLAGGREVGAHPAERPCSGHGVKKADDLRRGGPPHWATGLIHWTITSSVAPEFQRNPTPSSRTALPERSDVAEQGAQQPLRSRSAVLCAGHNRGSSPTAAASSALGRGVWALQASASSTRRASQRVPGCGSRDGSPVRRRRAPVGAFGGVAGAFDRELDGARRGSGGRWPRRWPPG